MAYKILINDGMDKEGLELFARERRFVVTNEHYDNAPLLETIMKFDAFLVRSSTIVTRGIIEEGAKGKLRLIGRGGVGVDNIDCAAAKEHGIIVKTAPNGVTNSTAEHTLFLAGAVARRISSSNFALRSGVWRKKPFQGIELAGKTWGIIGCGRIGQTLAVKARGLGMETIGFDVDFDYVKESFPDSVIEYRTKEEVLGSSDILSLHTGGVDLVIGAPELAMMKPSAILINASRGPNLDEEALYNALIQEKLYGAGLDTYRNEPEKEIKPTTPSMRKLVGLANVVMTPHLGASTKEGQRKTSVELARVTMDFFLEGKFTNSVNTVRPSLEEKLCYTLCIYHDDCPNMFGQMSHVLGSNGVNIRDNPSEIIGDNSRVVTNYIVHQAIDNTILEELRGIPGVHRVLFTDPYN